MRSDDDCFVFDNRNDHYIYQQSPNKGFAQIPNCVLRCFFLSDGAKKVIGAIYSHCYGDRKEAFPSQALLALEAGMTKRSVTNFLNELKEADLIAWRRRKANTSNIYVIMPPHNSRPVLVSDIIWRAIQALNKQGHSLDDLLEAAKHLIRHNGAELLDTAGSYGNETMFLAISGAIEHYIKEGGDIMHRLFVAGTYNGQKVEQVTSAPIDQPQERKKDKVEPSAPKAEKSIQDYNVNDWLGYYLREYHTGKGLAVYSLTLEDRKHMSRLVKGLKIKPEVLVKMIPMFLKAKYFEGFKTLRYMTSQRSLDLLQSAIAAGFESVDDYLAATKGKTVAPTALPEDETSDLSEWAERMRKK